MLDKTDRPYPFCMVYVVGTYIELFIIESKFNKYNLKFKL